MHLSYLTLGSALMAFITLIWYKSVHGGSVFLGFVYEFPPLSSLVSVCLVDGAVSFRTHSLLTSFIPSTCFPFSHPSFSLPHQQPVAGPHLVYPPFCIFVHNVNTPVFPTHTLPSSSCSPKGVMMMMMMMSVCIIYLSCVK